MSVQSKNVIFPLVAGAVLVITSVISGVTVSGHNATLAAQQLQIDELHEQVKAARAGTSALESSISMHATGADAVRVADDSDSIGELLSRALTWENNDEYSEARDSTMRVYGLAEDTAFMKSFLPAAPVNTDSQGNKYPYIDAAGLNSSVSDFRVKVLSVDAVNYRYMALADVRGRSSDGLGSAVNVATVFVTVDGDGKMTNISGFASTSQVRKSG